MNVDPAALAKYPIRRRPERKPNLRSPISRCDALISIVDVLVRYCATPCPKGADSYKIRCPFGAEHADGGTDPNCRVYASNTMFCFAQHGQMKPSSLLAYAKGWTRPRAAEFLLTEAGLNRDLPWQERYALAAVEPPKVSAKTQELSATLQREMSAVPGYAEHEFSEPVRQTWTDLLAALDYLTTKDVGPETYSRWYSAARSRLLGALTSVNPAP